MARSLVVPILESSRYRQDRKILVVSCTKLFYRKFASEYVTLLMFCPVLNGAITSRNRILFGIRNASISVKRDGV